MKIARYLLALTVASSSTPAFAQAPASPTLQQRPARPDRPARPVTTRPAQPATPATPARPATPAAPAAPARPATPATPATPVAAPPGSPTPNASLSAEQVIAGVQSFYDRTNDFEADFTQESRNRLTGGTQRRTGHVRFKKPGRMRWDYDSPRGDLIVSDGNTLWAYEAAARQAIQSNLQQSQLPSALSFLTGTGRLANDFTFRTLDARRFQYPTGYVIELRPSTPNPSFARLLFFVEPANYQVVRTVVFDAQGNSNRFDFRTPRVNVNPNESVFRWTPPAGTQVVRP